MAGKAAVIAARVFLWNGAWRGKRYLSGSVCLTIGPMLEPVEIEVPTPNRLAENEGRCYQRSNLWGKGFILTDEQASALIKIDERNREVIKPFIGGDEVNSLPDVRPIRWVIDMGERSREDAEMYGAPFAKACFDTFPMPEGPSRSVTLQLGQRFHDQRARFCRDRNIGLSKLYAEVNDSSNHDNCSKQMRRLIADLDHEAVAAYRWSDLNLEHGFHELAGKVRYTIGDEPRREIIHRLTELNGVRVTGGAGGQSTNDEE